MQMKKRELNIIMLAMVLSLSAFSGCSQIDQETITDSLDSNVNTEDMYLEDTEFETQSAEDDSTLGTVDSTIDSLEETSLEESVSESQTSSTFETQTTTIADTSNSTTTTANTSQTSASVTTSLSIAEGFDVPAGGSVSSSDIAVKSISLDKYDVTISVGESDMPMVSMLPDNATDKSEIWESSNTQVATVDSYGNIKGISEGTCKVTVKSKSNVLVYAEVSVTVTPKTVKPTYIEDVLIVNKTYGLPEDYDPYNGSLAPEVLEAFNKMAEDASKEGLNLYISSGYRSYAYQEQVYENYAQYDGYANADKYSARPGYSEHQSALCFDLNTINDSFADTAEGKWVAENCYKYGFIIRYPKGKESITGYQYEPWHLRYLGEFLATDVYNSGLCLEEFLGVTSEYAD